MYYALLASQGKAVLALPPCLVEVNT